MGLSLRAVLSFYYPFYPNSLSVLSITCFYSDFPGSADYNLLACSFRHWCQLDYRLAYRASHLIKMYL